MKLKALKNITVAGKHYIAGEIFEIGEGFDANVQDMIEHGSVEIEDDETDE